MICWTAGVFVDTPLKMFILRLIAANLPLLPRLLEIYTGSILVRPGIEEGRENIFISLHKTPVLNARHDCGCPSSERIRYNEGQRGKGLKWSLSKEILNRIALFNTEKKKSLKEILSYKMMNGKRKGREWWLLYLIRQEHRGTKWGYQTAGFTEKVCLHIMHSL